jgi:hypothetical protein
MEHDHLPVAAATLAAAIIAKSEFPTQTDIGREAMRIYRQTLRKMVQGEVAEGKKAGGGPKTPT